jgi:hypothetical protein
LLVRSTRFHIAFDAPILRAHDRAVFQLVLSLNIDQLGSEALNQIISKREHMPDPNPPGAAALSVAQFTSMTTCGMPGWQLVRVIQGKRQMEARSDEAQESLSPPMRTVP